MTNVDFVPFFGRLDKTEFVYNLRFFSPLCDQINFLIIVDWLISSPTDIIYKKTYWKAFFKENKWLVLTSHNFDIILDALIRSNLTGRQQKRKILRDVINDAELEWCNSQWNEFKGKLFLVSEFNWNCLRAFLTGCL